MMKKTTKLSVVVYFSERGGGNGGSCELHTKQDALSLLNDDDRRILEKYMQSSRLT